MSSLTRGTRLARRTSTAAVALLTSVALPGIAAAQSTDIAALEAQVQALAAEVQALKGADQAAPAHLPQQGVAPSGTAAMLTPDQLPRPAVQQPPSPGIAGQPFFAELPEGRTTGVMATGNDTVRLTFSGQINRALNIIDDGIDTELFQVDNENASSRFRFLGETSPFRETQAVSLFEFEWPANGSLDVNQLEPNVPDALNKTLNLRLLEVGFSNNRYGSFFIGKGWMASDGTSETDLSGITTPAWSGQTFAYGGMLPTQTGPMTTTFCAPAWTRMRSGFDPDSSRQPLRLLVNIFVNVFSWQQSRRPEPSATRPVQYADLRRLPVLYLRGGR